eukprot:1056501-Pyramimonas_sp.AAC.1
MDKCDLSEADWEVVGKSPARRFIIQFSGDANASARKVRAFYSKLKGPDGDWVNTEVQRIHGQSTRLFLGLDRSGKNGTKGVPDQETYPVLQSARCHKAVAK